MKGETTEQRELAEAVADAKSELRALAILADELSDALFKAAKNHSAHIATRTDQIPLPQRVHWVGRSIIIEVDDAAAAIGRAADLYDQLAD